MSSAQFHTTGSLRFPTHLSVECQATHDPIGERRVGMLLNPGCTITKAEICSSPDNVLYVRSQTLKLYKVTPQPGGRVEVICALERSMGQEGKYYLETDLSQVICVGGSLRLKAEGKNCTTIETSSIYALGLRRDGINGAEFEQLKRAFNVASVPNTEEETKPDMSISS